MKIAIDAGHGSDTPGKRTPDGYREHWANVKVASYFAKAMDRCGVSYIKTGWNDDNSKDDADVALSTRQKQIKAAKCDYSISFHFNACGDGTTYNTGEGIETLYSNKYPGDSKRMAETIQKELLQGTPQKNRGAKTQSLAMCNCNALGTKASVLIECSFMTNKREAELMQSDAFCQECAEEAARGFCKYVGIPYYDTSIPTPVEEKPTPAPAPTPAPVQNSSYIVKVNVAALNVRKGPGTNYDVNCIIKNGEKYTIVEESGHWGKLKSGAGWINLTYVVRV